MERLKVVARCDTDSTMRHFAYAFTEQDADGDYVTYAEAIAEIARLTAALERATDGWSKSQDKQIAALERAEKAEAALSESQAMLAMREQRGFAHGLKSAEDHVRSMRATDGVLCQRTLNLVATGLAIAASKAGIHDAQAALDARINAAKEEGRVMGLREAAETVERAPGYDNIGGTHPLIQKILAKIKEAEK